MNKEHIKTKDYKNIFWIFMFLSFFQIIFFPFLKDLFVETLYKPFPFDKVKEILSENCNHQKAKIASKNTIIFQICDKEFINNFKNFMKIN
tara:strand:+ start:2025 stop:2297 length:273 start_codon:yes stop_codon:yes gene_type:complete